MKLLLFCDYHPGLLQGLMETLDRVYHDERVLIRKTSYGKWQESGTRVIELPLKVIHEESGMTLLSILIVPAYLALATIAGVIAVLRRRLDAILGVFAFPQGTVAVLVGSLTRRRVAILTDGGDVDILLGNSFVRTILLASLRKAHAVTSLNGSKANRLSSFGVQSMECPTVGVDLTRFQYVPVERKVRNSILYVGRLSAEKRPEVLLAACEKIRREAIPFTLHLVGDGQLRNEISVAIRRMHLEECVTIWGYVPHSEVHRHFAQCSIFVLPSAREGVSVSLLEAMASGCLCIVSNIRDNKEIILDGRNGFLFRTDDEEDLADALRRALVEPRESLASMVARARLEVERQYSTEVVTDTLTRMMAAMKMPETGRSA